jgi:hypothetical protein
MSFSLIAALAALLLALAATIQWWQNASILWILVAIASGLGSAFLFRKHFR